MVGNESIYDVIVLEYDRSYYFGLTNLIQRLRQRFPHAIIIMTDIFRFEEIEVIDLTNNKNILSLRQYMLINGYPTNTEQSLQFLKDRLKSLKFQFKHNLEEKHVYMEQLASEYDSIIYRWNTTTVAGQDMKDIVFYYLPFVSEDQIHLNHRGHQILASGMKEIVKREIQRKVETSNNANEQLGSWGEGDHCVTWFHDGAINYKTAGITRIEFGTRKAIDFSPIEQFLG